MKKIIRFLVNLLNTVWRHLRTFAWKKLIPWCALFLGICLFFGGCIVAISAAVCHKTKSRITTVEALCEAGEHFDLILVLGCAVRPDGTLSHMLEDRVKIGASLFKAGLADAVLMSGDRSVGYDEVSAMEREAISLGVSSEAILLDPKGYSTYESVCTF